MASFMDQALERSDILVKGKKAYGKYQELRENAADFNVQICLERTDYCPGGYGGEFVAKEWQQMADDLTAARIMLAEEDGVYYSDYSKNMEMRYYLYTDEGRLELGRTARETLEGGWSTRITVPIGDALYMLDPNNSLMSLERL